MAVDQAGAEAPPGGGRMKAQRLSPADLAAIETAVREAETRTSGEIYCVVAEESSDYHGTPIAWGAGVALLAPAILLTMGLQVSAPDAFSVGGWTASQVEDIGEATARAALIGTLINSFSPGLCTQRASARAC